MDESIRPKHPIDAALDLLGTIQTGDSYTLKQIRVVERILRTLQAAQYVTEPYEQLVPYGDGSNDIG